jgi:hypothetical protein
MSEMLCGRGNEGIVVSRDHSGVCTRRNHHLSYDITIDGEIKVGDAKEFERIAGFIGNNTALVILSGPGGTFTDAREIGNSIRRHNWNTQVKDEECLSACATIWISGVKRWASEKSLIGFHAVYDGKSGQESGPGNALVGAYFKDKGLSDEAIAYLTMAPPDMVVYLNAESASKYSIAYEGRLPMEAYIQLLLQFAMRQKALEKSQEQTSSPAPAPPPPPQSRPQPQPPPEEKRTIVAYVAQNLNLRASPTPFSANVLEYLWPNYIPAGKYIDFYDLNTGCTMISSGDVWCKTTHYHENGYSYSGWINAYYLNWAMARECRAFGREQPDVRVHG